MTVWSTLNLERGTLNVGTLEPSSILEFWDMTNKQDWFVCELAQQGISSRGYTPGPYSNREELLYQFDQFIVNRLKAAGDI